MGKRITKSSRSRREWFGDQHRFEHWYVDHQVYFITAKVHQGIKAFASEQAKTIFWDRLEHWAGRTGFELWAVSLLDNHYHVLGYLEKGEQLKLFMQRVHGSTAKLVNDVSEEHARAGAAARGLKDGLDGSGIDGGLGARPAEAGEAGAGEAGVWEGARIQPFWGDKKGKEYFDGCIRDQMQLTRAYRYVLRQSERHGVCANWRDYSHTRWWVTLEEAVRLAVERGGLMEGVAYRRYLKKRGSGS